MITCKHRLLKPFTLRITGSVSIQASYVFKILNGHANIDPNIFVKIKRGKITRGHDFTLVKGQNRLDFRKYSFSQRTVNAWNKLSANCVHSSSVTMFKNRIENYLVSRKGRIGLHLDSYMLTLDKPTASLSAAI